VLAGLLYCCRYSKSLARVIADDGAAPNGLPLPRILRYGTQTLAALHELHSQSVVLMDLKPQNLLLEEALDELVVTDFGLSKVVSHTLGGFRASTVGCGTPNYM
jgi:serine/threonine-protein kinase